MDAVAPGRARAATSSGSSAGDRPHPAQCLGVRAESSPKDAELIAWLGVYLLAADSLDSVAADLESLAASAVF